MPDRRTVDELTIEELEHLLIIKRREARTERMRRLQEIGRLPAEAALPHEDLSTLGLEVDGRGDGPEPAPSRRHAFDVEPLRGRKGRAKERNRS
ncbi:MAG: hypothetical protein PVF77_10400, partial [Anaerolineae bacterium]